MIVLWADFLSPLKLGTKKETLNSHDVSVSRPYILQVLTWFTLRCENCKLLSTLPDEGRREHNIKCRLTSEHILQCRRLGERRVSDLRHGLDDQCNWRDVGNLHWDIILSFSHPGLELDQHWDKSIEDEWSTAMRNKDSQESILGKKKIETLRRNWTRTSQH